MVMETADTSTPNFKELKPCKKRKIEEKPDRISSLPDAILHHIFSFLSAIDVVQTDVLASRWRHLWTEMPILDFDDDSFPYKDRENAFIQFVDGVHNHYKASNIKRYYVSIQEPLNASCLDNWIQFAVEHNVEELGVDLCDDVPLEIPVCGSVKMMRLQMKGGDLMLPISGCFRSIESLYLSGANFANDTIMVDAQCFPQLKCLNLVRCTGLYCLDINSAVLEHLNIEECYGLDQLNVSADKLHILDIKNNFYNESVTSLVRISAPSLRCFRWLDYITHDFHMTKSTSMVDAHISLVLDSKPGAKETYLKNASKFLSYLVHVDSLSVELACFWGLSAQRMLLEGLLTPPCNLKHLKFLVGHDGNVFRGISGLIKSCSNLEVLHVQIVDDETLKAINRHHPGASLLDKSQAWNYERVSLNHLHEVMLRGFRGKEHEEEFAKFLLEYAPVLKKMTIFFSRTFTDESMKSQIMHKLKKFRSTSLDAILSFS